MPHMGEGRREGGDRTEPQRRLTVPEAAAELGTTSEGIRSRIKRGTLRTVREGGRVFVILEGAPTGSGAAPSGDRAGDRAELVDELRDRVTFLERELGRRAGEAAELRRIIAALTQRIPHERCEIRLRAVRRTTARPKGPPVRKCRRRKDRQDMVRLLRLGTQYSLRWFPYP